MISIKLQLIFLFWKIKILTNWNTLFNIHLLKLYYRTILVNEMTQLAEILPHGRHAHWTMEWMWLHHWPHGRVDCICRLIIVHLILVIAMGLTDDTTILVQWLVTVRQNTFIQNANKNAIKIKLFLSFIYHLLSSIIIVIGTKRQ